MSRYRSDPESLDLEKPSACSNCLFYTWKIISCLFSHATLITMVVSYCVLGAFTFEKLEGANELQVKKEIQKLRDNTSFHLWNFTNNGMKTIMEANFTPKATEYLQDFEAALLKAITKDGWNGSENETNVQWTKTGALFYSIVVITTIGYGHLTPKTPWGKVVTIFYAIIGIPLMLLCLSKIGDVMATSFRFLYWRVCCYVCQKKPKNKQLKRGRSVKGPQRNEFARSKSASFRRSVRHSGKSTEARYGGLQMVSGYHSDPDLRRPNGPNLNTALHLRGSSLPTKSVNKYTDKATMEKNHLPENNNINSLGKNEKGGSLNKKKSKSKGQDLELDPVAISNTPILCNRYVIGKNDVLTTSNIPDRRATSVPKSSKFLEVPRIETPDFSSDGDDDSPSLKSRPKIKPRRRSRSKSPMPSSVPKMMTPLGYGHRNKYLDDPDTDDDDYDGYYDDRDKVKKKHVPIWLCVLLVISYILAGMYLFKTQENWEYLDAAYFCFITLTTIGFGDLVPAKAQAVSHNDNESYETNISIALCSLYLLFGISLLAMSFNLVQEEVISNVKSVAKTLGIIKSDSDVSEDEDE